MSEDPREKLRKAHREAGSVYTKKGVPTPIPHRPCEGMGCDDCDEDEGDVVTELEALRDERG